MSSTSASTSFRHVIGRGLLHTGQSIWSTPNFISDLVSSTVLARTPINVKLCFQVATKTSLADLRINIRDLFSALWSYNNPLGVIQISLTSTDDPTGQEEKTEIGVVTLQKDLFLLLFDVLDSDHRFEAKPYTEQLPELWMNG
jgi:hypothetical protein